MCYFIVVHCRTSFFYSLLQVFFQNIFGFIFFFFLLFLCLFLVLYPHTRNACKAVHILHNFPFLVKCSFCHMLFASYMTFITSLNYLHSKGFDYTVCVNKLALINDLNKYISFFILLENLKSSQLNIMMKLNVTQ